MQILILASYSPSLINFRGPLIRKLVSLSYTVSVAAPDIPRTIREQLSALGVDSYETPLERTGQSVLSDAKYLLSLRRIIRVVKPDLVFTYTIKPNIWGAIAAKLANVPSVAMVTGLGHLFVQPNTDMGIKARMINAGTRTLYSWATRLNRRVIFQNQDDKNDFLAAGDCGDDGLCPTKL